jgi:uncharacterized protein (TIGR02569 family)
VTTPPPHVVDAFTTGRSPVPVPLSSGRGTAWRVGEVILKPLDLPVTELEWQAEILAGLTGDGFRVAAPLRSSDGELVVDGWSAWPRLAGGHRPRWTEIIAAGAHFHAALRGAPRPSELLDARTHHWARADRIAWGEAPAAGRSAEVAWLLQARRELHLPAQVIHGDLSGNILFADGLAPAIIDFSPYWRPAAYASAVIVVDAVVWHGADPALLDLVAGERDGVQMLIRALLFRRLSDSQPTAGAYPAAMAYLRSL